MNWHQRGGITCWARVGNLPICLHCFVAGFLTEHTMRTVRYSSEEVAFKPLHVAGHPPLLPPYSPGYINKSKGTRFMLWRGRGLSACSLAYLQLLVWRRNYLLGWKGGVMGRCSWLVRSVTATVKPLIAIPNWKLGLNRSQVALGNLIHFFSLQAWAYTFCDILPKKILSKTRVLRSLTHLPICMAKYGIRCVIESEFVWWMNR